MRLTCAAQLYEPHVLSGAHSIGLYSAIMRYVHGLIGDQELCDCSPGPTLCCTERFDNRVFRLKGETEANGAYPGSLSYFQLLGDQAPTRGTLELRHMAAYAEHGTRPTPKQFPCPAGFARNWTWEYSVPVLLNRLGVLRPTHLVLNMGHWVYNHHDTGWWKAIAAAGRKLQHQHGTVLLWRTHPLPANEFTREEGQLPYGVTPHLALKLSEIFQAAKWQVYDAAAVVRAFQFQGGRLDSAIFNPTDRVHLSVEANGALVKHLLGMLCSSQ